MVGSSILWCVCGRDFCPGWLCMGLFVLMSGVRVVMLMVFGCRLLSLCLRLRV